MLVSLALAASLSISHAQDTGFDDAGYAPPVVGGTQVPAGRWDDTVLVVMANSLCTGTLVGPRTVITAAHCNESVRGVMVGTKNYYDQSQGEYYEASQTINHPNYRGFGYDIAVVKLRQPVVGVEPRAFAIDCAQDFIRDGNEVQIVGFGATQTNGGGNNSALNEATTYITDHDCSDDYYCDQSMPNNSEITAGLNGIDSCFGDSGGPLYLATPYGYTLVGVTSRAGSQSSQPCGGGGIYTRADTFFDWFQQVSDDVLVGPSCNEPAELNVESFGEVPNTGRSSTGFSIADGDSTSWTFGVPVQPAYGVVEFDADGRTLYFTGDGEFIGRDEFVFSVTDDAGNVTEVTVPLVIVEGVAGCGCSSTSTSMGWWGLGLVGLLGLRRRRNA